MKTYVGKSGKSYELIEPPWKSGGEGAIYRIQGDTRIVAKIFQSEKRSIRQQRKLELMVRTPQYTAIDEQTTWPKELLYENGKPIGYIMKTVENGEMLCAINGPDYSHFSWGYKLVIAINLCSAVAAIHTIGHVIGDMNPRNILVNSQNLGVTLIDIDSYHLFDYMTQTFYPCSVGIGEFIAPELLKRMQHGESLEDLELPTFTKETDNFALAVHIFMLLMDGWHPFSCRVIDTTEDSVPCPQKPENILSGFSPYFSSNSKFGIPRNAPSLDRLPKQFQELFRMAFIDGYNEPSKRPSAYTWGQELRKIYNTQIYVETQVSQPKKEVIRSAKTKQDENAEKPKERPRGRTSRRRRLERKRARKKRQRICAAVVGFAVLAAVIVFISSKWKHEWNQSEGQSIRIEDLLNTDIDTLNKEELETPMLTEMDTREMTQNPTWETNENTQIAETEAEQVAKTEAPTKSVIENQPSELNVRGQGIRDLSLYSDYDQVTKLWLGDNPFSDLTPIGNLTALQLLDVSQTNITTLEPLKNLTNLTHLSFGETGITDISVLASFPNLRVVDFWYCPVNDISVLSQLINLEEIYISYTNVTSLQAIMNLPNLKLLAIRGLTLSRREYEQFQALHPDCKIYYPDEVILVDD